MFSLNSGGALVVIRSCCSMPNPSATRLTREARWPDKGFEKGRDLGRV